MCSGLQCKGRLTCRRRQAAWIRKGRIVSVIGIERGGNDFVIDRRPVNPYAHRQDMVPVRVVHNQLQGDIPVADDRRLLPCRQELNQPVVRLNANAARTVADINLAPGILKVRRRAQGHIRSFYALNVLIIGRRDTKGRAKLPLENGEDAA